MDSFSWIVLSVAAAYLLTCLMLGLLAGRKTSVATEGYVAGDRSLGLVTMYFITGATVFSAFAFLGAPGWAYSRGAAGFYILAYGILGFLPFYFLGPRAARVGRHYGFVTQAEMVAHRFRSPLLAGWMALISVVALIPYLALQMKGAGLVIQSVTRGQVSPQVGSFVVYGIVTWYVVRSGVLGVGWTNTFQGIFMMLLAWGLGLSLPRLLYGGVTEMFQQIEASRPELLRPPGLDSSGNPWSWGEYSSAVIVSSIGFTAWPHLFMKAFTASSVRTIQKTAVLYPTFQLFVVPLFLIGFAGVRFSSAPDQVDQVLPHMLMNLEISPWWVGLFCAGALAASMSSGDAMAHAAASIAVRDGACRGAGWKPTPTQERRWIRGGVLVVMGLSYAVTVHYEGSLVTLLLRSYGAVVQFAPALWLTLYVPRVSRAAVLSGLVLGSVTTLLLMLEPSWRPWPVHAGAYGLMANVVAVGLAQIMNKGPEDREFLNVAAGLGANTGDAGDSGDLILRTRR